MKSIMYIFSVVKSLPLNTLSKSIFNKYSDRSLIEYYMSHVFKLGFSCLLIRYSNNGIDKSNFVDKELKSLSNYLQEIRMFKFSQNAFLQLSKILALQRFLRKLKNFFKNRNFREAGCVLCYSNTMRKFQSEHILPDLI